MSNPSVEATAVSTSFHLFNNLPAELRAQIWQLCLPHRIRELDELTQREQWNQFDRLALEHPTPCRLKATTRANNRPPAITQVCREARKVAFLAAGLYTMVQSDQLATPTWDVERPWIDHIRDAPHFYDETGVFDLMVLAGAPWARCGKRSIPLHHLDRYPAEGDNSQYDDYDLDTRPHGGQPPRIGLPDPEQYPLAYRDCLAIQQHATWQVVIDIVVVHMTAAHATASGLFGLLGDAPIQMVDAFDIPACTRFYDLTDASEQFAIPYHRQKFRRTEPYRSKLWIQNTLWSHRYPDDLLPRLQPAIMFRLCTQACNHQS